MHVQTIINALSNLDPENDDHWTSDGAPRLDVLAPSLPGVKREHVLQAAPLFNRKNPVLPDLEATREAAEKAAQEADDAVRDAELKKKKAAEASRTLQQQTAEIKDRHTLTRQNQAWINSQIEADKNRAAHQQRMDQVVRDAGGLGQIGAHPVERNEALRIRNNRRQVIIPAKKANP